MLYLIIIVVLLIFLSNIWTETTEYYHKLQPSEWNKCRTIDDCKYNLSKHGVIIIPNAIEPVTCDHILTQIFNQLNHTNEQEMGKIHARERRLDLHLPIEGACKQVMLRIYKKYKSIFSDIVHPKGLLKEFSVLFNFPYSDPQLWHRDIDMNESSDMFSVGVSLQDTTEDMGPLEAILGTHRTEYVTEQASCDRHHDNICGYFNRVKPTDVHKATCQKGSIIIWNNKVIHRSSMNTSKSLRAIFYFTLLYGTVVPIGSTYSMMKKYKQKNILLD